MVNSQGAARPAGDERMKLFEKLFGTYSERQIKRIRPMADRIEALGPEYEKKSDEELRAVTAALRARLTAGESEDDILPDAFAAVREADRRVLGKRPFYVQLLGGILLHQGRIAEMKTGEGKTLVATMPAYLNALSGRGVHIVTVNDYLARRDSEEMGRVYGFLGMTTGLVLPGMSRAEKQEAYRADITYGTNNEFGFDYLRDNMVIYRADQVQRGHHFAIVDEVDSILIDEARTPLIISGNSTKSTDFYEKADAFARPLSCRVIKETDPKEANDMYEEDYVVDEKAHSAFLTQNGIRRAEKFFGIENLSDPENATIVHHINLAIRAYGLMKRDVQYVVKDGHVVIVDAFTGRLMPGRRYSDGLHQAIEAKERVAVEQESRTLATVTFQNYFRMYEKLSGMTGTAQTEEEEFREIYALDVVEVPTNLPMIRHDHNDAVFFRRDAKLRAIVDQIRACHEKGQPILVGTIAIDKSEELSRLLKKEGIPHTVLNAKHHEKEAEIVAQAGKLGAVTIATNMAGRGTDIMLGGNPEYMAKRRMAEEGYDEDMIAAAISSAVTDDEEILAARERFAALLEAAKEEVAPNAADVRRAGGLYILGTERHESRRIDNQLRGRAGRQGDPGESKFFVSFEDDLLRLFANSRIFSLINTEKNSDLQMEMGLITRTIENAQRKIESINFNRRKSVLTYDDVMNQQRNLIYKQRAAVLNDADLRKTISGMIEESVGMAFDLYISDEERNFTELRNHFMGLLTTPQSYPYTEEEAKALSHKEIAALREELLSKALSLYESKDDLFGAEQMREVERAVLLRTVDEKWMDHIDAMDDLKDTISLNAYAQRNPVSEYRIVGSDMFDAMIADIRDTTARRILSVMPREKIERVQTARPNALPGEDGGSVRRGIIKTAGGQVIGPNSSCPCGSGKRYKRCCGKNAAQK